MAHMMDDRAPPERGTPEWYLHKRNRRLNGRQGGRLARFREIAQRKPARIEDIVEGTLAPVFDSEYRYYVWNVEPVLCAYCNERLTKQTRTRDHVVPRSQGGPNGDNLVPACAACNRDKGDDRLLMYMFRRDMHA